MTLLQKALELPATPKRETDTDDDVRLAVAWMNGVVTDAQVAGVWGITIQGVASRLGRILRRSTVGKRTAVTMPESK